MKFRLSAVCYKSIKNISRLFASLILLFGLAACGTNRETDFMEGACVSLINHSPERIRTSYINGTWTGGATAFAGNGGFCGVKLPKKWQEGLTVSVKWTNALVTDDIKKYIDAETIWHEQIVPVPQYKTLDAAVLHFMPNGKIILTMNLTPNQMPYDLQQTKQPDNWREPDNYYCEHIKLLNMTAKQCRQKLDEGYK